MGESHDFSLHAPIGFAKTVFMAYGTTIWTLTFANFFLKRTAFLQVSGLPVGSNSVLLLAVLHPRGNLKASISGLFVVRTKVMDLPTPAIPFGTSTKMLSVKVALLSA